MVSLMVVLVVAMGLAMGIIVVVWLYRRKLQRVKKQVEELMSKSFPESSCLVIIREAKPKPRRREQQTTTSEICRIVAIASGKGGVGKSLVTSMLAVTMQRRGYKCAILDADITGPSIPRIFGAHGDDRSADQIS